MVDERQTNKTSDGPRHALTLKDIFGQVWLLLPAVIAGEQLVRLSGGDSMTLLALSSAVDIKSLILGIMLPNGSAIAAIILAMKSRELIYRLAGMIDSMFLSVAIWLAGLVICAVYLPWYYASVIAFVAATSPITDVQKRNRFLLGMAIVFIALGPALSPAWIRPEVVTTKSGHTYVAYVVNPDQGGWMTVLTLRSHNAVRLQSSDVTSRSVCDYHPKSVIFRWGDAYPAPLIWNFSRHPKVMSCPHT